MFDTPIFTLDDVRNIRKVSVNINDFEMFAVEAQRNYLSKLLGDKLYTQLILNPTEARMIDLIDGKIYQDGGREVIFRGVKVYLCYVWLYLFHVSSSVKQTPVGAVTFKDEEAEHAEISKSGQFERDHFIKSADGMDDGILRFLRRNRNTYPEFSESRQIKQASKDNIVFRSFGSTYYPPDNFIC